MNWLRAALTSSVGKKFVMGVTGLLLCGFLVVHLAGNLLMLAGPEAYNDYAESLHSNEWLVKIGEALLLVLFASHIYLAFVTTRENSNARGPVEYALRESKIEQRTLTARISPENWMFVTGAVVLGFLILHLCDFTFEVRDDFFYVSTDDDSNVQRQPFDKAVLLLRNPLTFGVYLAGCFFLAWHLGHGVSSAFQSLGVNHPKYNGLIKWAGILFALVIGIGFIYFPMWAVFQPVP